MSLLLLFRSAAASASGSLSATESGADTAALSGDVLVAGSLAVTESGADTAALAGDVLVDGTLAATESGADIAALAGDVLIDGTLAATESGADVAAIFGENEAASAWPAVLPQSFAADQYQETREGMLLRTGTDAGPALVRRRYSVSRTVASGNMVLDADQLVALNAFYDEADSFPMDPIGDGTIRTLRFMAPPRRTPLAGAALWRVDMLFEVVG